MNRRIAGAVLVAAVTLAGCHRDSTPAAAPHRLARVEVTTTTTTVPPTTTTTVAPPPDFSATMSGDPAATAGAIAAAERATLDPATTPEVVHAAAYALQLGYRRIGALDPSFEAAVTAALADDGLRQALALNVAAVRELLSLGHSHAAAPPAAWHIVPVAGTDELLGYYREAAAATGVPWEVLAAIHLVETKLGRVVGDSSAGAQGPMQFLPATWARYGQGDIHSNRDAIMGAARYLAANGAPARLDDALHHYNPTPKYVNAVKDYAQRLRLNPNAYRGYHEWQVIFRTATGNLLLPEGWPAVPAQPVALP